MKVTVQLWFKDAQRFGFITSKCFCAGNPHSDGMDDESHGCPVQICSMSNLEDSMASTCLPC